MYKKLMSALLAAVMALSLSFALAEDVPIPEVSPSFDLTITLPEGATLENNMFEELSLNTIHLANPAKPTYTVAVAYDDLYMGRSLPDLSEEELEELFFAAIGMMDEEIADYTMHTLEDGVMIMIVYESESPEYVDVLTLRDGFFIELFGGYQGQTEPKPVTQEDFEYAVELIDAIHIVPVEAKK